MFLHAITHSIGRVNHELYALSAGTWDREDPNCEGFSDSEVWMRNFIDVLCVNSWQVSSIVDPASIKVNLEKIFLETNLYLCRKSEANSVIYLLDDKFFILK